MEALQDNMDNLDRLITDHLERIRLLTNQRKDPKARQLEVLNRIQYACSALDAYIEQYWVLHKVQIESKDSAYDNS